MSTAAEETVDLALRLFVGGSRVHGHRHSRSGHRRERSVTERGPRRMPRLQIGHPCSEGVGERLPYAAVDSPGVQRSALELPVIGGDLCFIVRIEAERLNELPCDHLVLQAESRP